MKYTITKGWSILINHLLIVFFILYLFSCINLILSQIIHSNGLCYLISFTITAFVLYSFSKLSRKQLSNCFCKIMVLYNDNIRAIIEKCLNKFYKIFFFVFVFPFLLKLILIYIFHTPILGDPAVYIDISKEITENGIICRNAEYSSNFPHLFWFGIFLSPASIFSNLGDWIFQVYISFIQCCNSLLIYLISKNILRNKVDAAEIAFLYSCFPSQLFCALTVTHEYAFTFFLLSAIALWTWRQNWLSWIIVCFLISIAKLLNSTGIVAVIALLCCIFFVWKDFNELPKRILALIFFSVLLVGTAYLANTFQIYVTEGNYPLRRSCVEWQLFIGGNAETEGRWSENDINIINDVVRNSESISEAKTALRELIFNRWIILLQSPSKLFCHLLNKFCNVWSGTHYSIELASIYVSGQVKSYLLLALILFNNFLYLILISLTIPKMWQGRKVIESDVILFIKTTIIGTVCMLLLTETMNKYSLSILGPIFLLFEFYINMYKQKSLSH